MTVEYKYDKAISLNELYTWHWGRKKKAVEQILNSIVMPAEVIKGEYGVEVKVNSRLDLDNNVGVAKIIIDHLRRRGHLEDDSPKYMRSYTILHSPELEKNTMLITITPL